MDSRWYCRVWIVLICCLCAGAFSPLHPQTQMTATVNSLADDSNAHPWNDPNTPEDESTDGVCEDYLHRCTLRAALEEAANMNKGQGVPCNLTISLAGTITISVAEGGSLSPPDGSFLHGGQQTTINSSASSSAFSLGHNTRVHGLKFTGGLYAISVAGDGNTISGNVFANFQVAGLLVSGLGNIIGGSASADRNIFTRISATGIYLSGDDNVVIGNYIGINAQGTLPGINLVSS